MPGLDDPRVLQQTITDLQTRVKTLETQTLALAANQKGPIPGFMRAVQINDPGFKSSMWMNLVGNQPGQSPYQAVTDTNGTIRVELGNLAANGNSPAQFGLRANNASGTPIFDSLGLIGVFKSLGVVSGSLNTSSTTYADVTSTLTITLTRPTWIYTNFSGTASYNPTGAQNGSMILVIDGTAQGGVIDFDATTSGAATAMLWDAILLAAGSHTFKSQGNVSGGTSTLQILQAFVECFQMGA